MSDLMKACADARVPPERAPADLAYKACPSRARSADVWAQLQNEFSAVAPTPACVMAAEIGSRCRPASIASRRCDAHPDARALVFLDRRLEAARYEKLVQPSAAEASWTLTAR